MAFCLLSRVVGDDLLFSPLIPYPEHLARKVKGKNSLKILPLNSESSNPSALILLDSEQCEVSLNGSFKCNSSTAQQLNTSTAQPLLILRGQPVSFPLSALSNIRSPSALCFLWTRVIKDTFLGYNTCDERLYKAPLSGLVSGDPAVDSLYLPLSRAPEMPKGPSGSSHLALPYALGARGLVTLLNREAYTAKEGASAGALGGWGWVFLAGGLGAVALAARALMANGKSASPLLSAMME